MNVNGNEHRVDYEPAESSTGSSVGNSNWRGPIWFPINFLLIESLQKFHHFYGDSVSVELQWAQVGRHHHVGDAAAEISRRLTRIFLRSEEGKRPVFGGPRQIPNGPRMARSHFIFTNTFMATMELASAQVTRRAGRDSSPN